jgi:hypothetical protein
VNRARVARLRLGCGVRPLARTASGACTVLVLAIWLGVASGAHAKVHSCAATNIYWTNIRVDHLSCAQAYQLHNRKLRECTSRTRQVTPTAYVYTCYFGPWTSTERIGRGSSFFDHVYIRRDRGRIWLRYDAVP